MNIQWDVLLIKALLRSERDFKYCVLCIVVNPGQYEYESRSENPFAQICSQELSENASKVYDQHRYPHNKVMRNNKVFNWKCTITDIRTIRSILVIIRISRVPDGANNDKLFQVCHRSCTKMKISTVYIARFPLNEFFQLLELLYIISSYLV